MKVYEGETKLIEIKTSIPQGSLILLILFLFFVQDLLNIINNEALRTSSFAFVDDTHILTYEDSTKRNYKTLKKIHKEYKEWLRTHSAKFAPKKYELIHFAKSPKGFNI
jgi:uncharacterized protein YcbK (DUF882 family)